MFDEEELARLAAPQPPTLKDLREKAGYSQAAVAQALDVESSTVYGWEREGSDSMQLTLPRLLAYSKLLGVSNAKFCDHLTKSVTLLGLDGEAVMKVLAALGSAGPKNGK